MQKLFLDTNIVVDFLGEREEVYRSAARVMTLADQKKIKIFTTSNTISTSYYLLSKYESPKAALEKIRKFKVLCSVSAMSDEVIDKAIASDFKDVEDAIQYFSAIATHCDLIITRNGKDFKNALIPVMNAESFLQTLK
ncbi:PIN domain-containing protein [Chryseobacterium suipulveris]|uniref:PIN domain-containing protein n=1 Tax=Chryseobacterium suipulveris TaxID=2929800 RepID=A0ABY4BNV2_9FLAO|nr:PIN domain-containing protein [Chryseobacterium suipulveris]UOE40865.1 PIN domain-containing protein [Chryseobacterium suipulveris]